MLIITSINAICETHFTFMKQKLVKFMLNVFHSWLRKIIHRKRFHQDIYERTHLLGLRLLDTLRGAWKQIHKMELQLVTKPK